MEKLTTDLLVEAIKITESSGSATIKVTVGYPRGEQSTLEGVSVAMEVYKASDYEDGEAPLTTLTTKLCLPLAKGDSRFDFLYLGSQRWRLHICSNLRSR